jgi:outer membrane protein assembly factor BamD (BamD/ComL family)
VKLFLSLLLLFFVQNDIYKQGKAQLDAKQYDAAEAAFNRLTSGDPATAPADMKV